MIISASSDSFSLVMMTDDGGCEDQTGQDLQSESHLGRCLIWIKLLRHSCQQTGSAVCSSRSKKHQQETTNRESTLRRREGRESEAGGGLGRGAGQEGWAGSVWTGAPACRWEGR